MYLILFAVACGLIAWLRWSGGGGALVRRGLRCGPALPLVGDMAGVLLRVEDIKDVLTRTLQRFPEDRFVGRYEYGTPIIVVRDPALIKKIAFKDFKHFVDRSIEDQLFKAEPQLGRSLLHLHGEEWRVMRSALSPIFTGSKIRQMVPFMVEVGQQMVRTLKTKFEEAKVDHMDVDAGAVAARCTIDVIATCGFGLDTDSLRERTQFIQMTDALTVTSFRTRMLFLGYKIAPWLMAWLRVNLYPSTLTSFFSTVVLSVMRQREEMNIHRPDIIHLLMEARKGKLAHDHDPKTDKDKHEGFATAEESEVGREKMKTAWTDVDLVSQAVTFLFAGYHSVAGVVSFLLYELATNPDCQERLVREIRENEEINHGNFDYKSLERMPYLDMVVSETLRKWPEAVLNRVCVRDYNLGKPNDEANEDFIIREGERVQIPVWAFHYHPGYFPEPHKFDPERFSEQNKHNIDPVVYMPFGLGPRNCIGARFAVCEVKVLVYQLLLHVRVAPCARSRVPPRARVTDDLQVVMAGGNWLRFTPRQLH